MAHLYKRLLYRVHAAVYRVDGWFRQRFTSTGMLLVGTGDGGGGGDPLSAGQDPTTLLGKLLRLDVDLTDRRADRSSGAHRRVDDQAHDHLGRIGHGDRRVLATAGEPRQGGQEQQDQVAQAHVQDILSPFILPDRCLPLQSTTTCD